MAEGTPKRLYTFYCLCTCVHARSSSLLLVTPSLQDKLTAISRTRWHPNPQTHPYAHSFFHATSVQKIKGKVRQPSLHPYTPGLPKSGQCYTACCHPCHVCHSVPEGRSVAAAGASIRARHPWQAGRSGGSTTLTTPVTSATSRSGGTHAVWACADDICKNGTWWHCRQYYSTWRAQDEARHMPHT